MVKLNKKLSFNVGLKQTIEGIVTILNILGVLCHLAEELGFQGDAGLWHGTSQPKGLR